MAVFLPGGGWDIILFLQPPDDCFGCVSTDLLAITIEIGHYFVQARNNNMGTIKKPERAPTNCRRFTIASGYSSL